MKPPGEVKKKGLTKRREGLAKAATEVGELGKPVFYSAPLKKNASVGGKARRLRGGRSLTKRVRDIVL